MHSFALTCLIFIWNKESPVEQLNSGQKRVKSHQLEVLANDHPLVEREMWKLDVRKWNWIPARGRSPAGSEIQPLGKLKRWLSVMHSVPVWPLNQKGQGHSPCFFFLSSRGFCFHLQYRTRNEFQFTNVTDYWLNSLQMKRRKGSLNITGDKFTNMGILF